MPHYLNKLLLFNVVLEPSCVSRAFVDIILCTTSGLNCREIIKSVACTTHKCCVDVVPFPVYCLFLASIKKTLLGSFFFLVMKDRAPCVKLQKTIMLAFFPILSTKIYVILLPHIPSCIYWLNVCMAGELVKKHQISLAYSHITQLHWKWVLPQKALHLVIWRSVRFRRQVGELPSIGPAHLTMVWEQCLQ